MKHRLLGVAVLVSLAAAAAAVSSATAPASGASVAPWPAFVTFLFGRAQYGVVKTCTPLRLASDTKTLDDVKRLFAARGWIASPNVVGRYADNGTCGVGRAVYATWAQLTDLGESPAGWQPVSAGKAYLPVARLTAAQVRNESCGSLPILAQHGFTRAWALYAYPGGDFLYDSGKGTASGNAQADIVRTCFAFGRRYGSGINARTALRPPWLVSAQSPIGGTAAGKHGTYRVPSRIIASNVMPGATPDHWLILQFYRFRSGYVAGDHNCLGPASTHFTRYNEEYCWEDFVTVVNAIPKAAVVTDPATVACSWGRFPDTKPTPTCK